MRFEKGDYVIRKEAPEFIWQVVDMDHPNKLIATNTDDSFLTLAPVCTMEGRPPIAFVKQKTWSWNCEQANAMVVLAYEASR